MFSFFKAKNHAFKSAALTALILGCLAQQTDAFAEETEVSTVQPGEIIIYRLYSQSLHRTNDDGTPYTGWYTFDDGRRGYCDSTGRLMTGFHLIDGSRYLFDSYGVMITGEYTDADGSKYLFTDDGRQYINCVGSVNGALHFYDADGRMVYGKFSFPDGGIGMTDSDGNVLTGSHLIGYEVCSFTSGGRLRHTVDATRPMVALTYDDGPSAENTPQILDVLRANNAYATFFVVGTNAAAYQNVLCQIYDSGCEIGNHTYNHVNLKSADNTTDCAQILSTSDVVQQTTGNRPTLLRPPGGNADIELDSLLTGLDSGYPLVMWSIDTRDWDHKDPAQTCAIIRQNVTDGSIILMHDIWSATVTASQTIIPELVSMGYQLVTVSELAAARGGMAAGAAYYSFDPSLSSAPTIVPVTDAETSVAEDGEKECESTEEALTDTGEVSTHEEDVLDSEAAVSEAENFPSSEIYDKNEDESAVNEDGDLSLDDESSAEDSLDAEPAGIDGYEASDTAASLAEVDDGSLTIIFPGINN